MPGRKTLLVEGDDDKHVRRNICSKRGISTIDEVQGLGGHTALLEGFSARLKVSQEGDVVGIVIDADTDPNARWQSIRDRLGGVGYQNVPTQPDPKGPIIEPPGETLLPRVGVWIMPDNQSTGKLEDFLPHLVPQTDALIDYATDVVDGLPEQRFRDQDRPKVVMHTWLAWQEKPGRPYGTAIEIGYLKLDVPQVDGLVSWLERLFNQPGSL